MKNNIKINDIDNLQDLTLDEWKNVYESLFGGFEDLDDDEIATLQEAIEGAKLMLGDDDEVHVLEVLLDRITLDVARLREVGTSVVGDVQDHPRLAQRQVDLMLVECHVGEFDSRAVDDGRHASRAT